MRKLRAVYMEYSEDGRTFHMSMPRRQIENPEKVILISGRSDAETTVQRTVLVGRSDGVW